jgi:hypothetical protein
MYPFPLPLNYYLLAIYPVPEPVSQINSRSYLPDQPGMITGLHGPAIAEGMVHAPVDPVSVFRTFIYFFSIQSCHKGLSQRELHILHAEITALQKTLGISYKDAAHRLYMAEVERLKKSDSAQKSFAAIRRRIDNLITHDICPPIKAIDKGEFDDYILKDGKWQKKGSDAQGSGSGS